jgi:hypothetical protein
MNKHSIITQKKSTLEYPLVPKKPSSSTTYFVLKNKGINLYIGDNYGYNEDNGTTKDSSSQIAIYLKNNFNYKRTSQPTLNSLQQ